MIDYIFIFILGAAIGSFINVWVLRSKEGEDIIFKPSHCVNCQHQLSFFDLIPVFSFLFLQGKCRYCKEKFSWQYLIMEIISGLMFATIYYLSGPVFLTLMLWLIFSVMLAILVFDFRFSLVSDQMVIAGCVLVTFFHTYNYYLLNQNLFSSLFLVYLGKFILSGLSFALPFFLISWLSQEKYMGYGDSEIGFFLGYFLGFKLMLINFLVAIFLGGIISLILIIFRGKNLKTAVPFGPFLISGAVIAFFAGEFLFNWYWYNILGL